MNNFSKRHLKWVFVMGLLLCLNAAVLPQELDSESLHPQFVSDHVILLTAVPHERSVISSQGRYVAGMLEDTVHSPDSITVHLWDLESGDGDIPYRSIVMTYNPLRPDQRGQGFALSPDERYLAVLQPTHLTILSLPELETEKVISLNWDLPINVGEVEWSPDSQLVATHDGNGKFLAYDIESDILYENIANTGETLANQDGWIAISHRQLASPYLSFTACTKFLEQCKTYEVNNLLPVGHLPYCGSYYCFVIISPDARQILVTWQEDDQDDRSVWRWQRGDDPITYTRDAQPMVELAGSAPRSFSNDGKYLVTDTTEIREANDGVLLQSIPECEWEGFFPNDSRYFLLSCPSASIFKEELRIYQLGQSDPVSTIKLEPLANIRNCPIGSLKPGLCDFTWTDFSNDGSRLLVFSRGRSMIIPIEYAPATIDD